MWQDPRYREASATRWAELRAGPWSDAAIKTLISDTETLISNAAVRNYQRFSDVLLDSSGGGDGETVWGSQVGVLQQWLLEHVAWIDGAIKKPASAGSGSAVSASGR